MANGVDFDEPGGGLVIDHVVGRPVPDMAIIAQPVAGHADQHDKRDQRGDFEAIEGALLIQQVGNAGAADQEPTAGGALRNASAEKAMMPARLPPMLSVYPRTRFG